MFVPGLVSQKTISVKSKRSLERLGSFNSVLKGYKVETEIDRKLLFGMWEEWPDLPDTAA